MCVQHHGPIEYNISNSCCHLKLKGTSNELTQIKTLIGQYCVYNIMSLQDITLQIPIVTKSSILDVPKVSQIWVSFIPVYFK